MTTSVRPWGTLRRQANEGKILHNDTGHGFDFQEIFALTTAPHTILDAEFRIRLANDAYCALVGLPEAELIGQDILKLFPESAERQAKVKAAFRQALDGQAAHLPELHYPIVDPEDPDHPATDYWWSLDCVPMSAHATYGPVFLVKLDDITRQVMARMRRDEFAAELQHRIGNALTLVQIIARKTGQNSTDLDSFLRVYESRIRALGKTHAFLSGVNWDGMTVRQIIEQQILAENVDRQASIRIDGPDWRLSVLHAQTFAMAVHELIANATAYGALSVPGGEVVISWDHPRDGSYYFVWKESGLTGLTVPEATGFGSQMIDRLLPGQLGGKAILTFEPTGFHYMLIVPEDVVVPVGQGAR